MITAKIILSLAGLLTYIGLLISAPASIGTMRFMAG